MNGQALVGSWELESYIRIRGSEVDFPMGESPFGLLIYLGNGQMAVQIAKRDRMKFRSQTTNKGKYGEKAIAFEGYVAYFGKYEANEEACIVHHFVASSLFPNMTGTVQERGFELSKDASRLKLFFALHNSRIKERRELSWKKSITAAN